MTANGKQKGCVLWFTGLSGAGKTTLSNALSKAFEQQGILYFQLDGDVLRTGLSKDLGFTKEDRDENIRRVMEVSKLFADCGVICMSAFISPFRAAREQARKTVGAERFLEVYLSAPLKTCEERDVKGLYKKARAGEIDDFTGISSPYEVPEHADMILDTTDLRVEDGVDQLMQLLTSRGFVRKPVRD